MDFNSTTAPDANNSLLGGHSLRAVAAGAARGDGAQSLKLHGGLRRIWHLPAALDSTLRPAGSSVCALANRVLRGAATQKPTKRGSHRTQASRGAGLSSPRIVSAWSRLPNRAAAADEEARRFGPAVDVAMEVRSNL